MISYSNFHVAIINVLTLYILVIAIEAPPSQAKPADNYVGIGARGRLGDDTVSAVNAKFKITDLDGASLSVRPTIFLGDYQEIRLSITGEKEIMPGWSPFIGGGLATNTDRSGETNLMLTGGLDWQINNQFVLQVGGNYIFQSSDTDAELMFSINYVF